MRMVSARGVVQPLSSWHLYKGFLSESVSGETRETGFDISKSPESVNDFHATALNQLGIDHQRLIYRFKGRDFRLTDVAGKVVKEILV